ncbi:23S rRNA (pseudouridine(1915)-N(3))-methyltransferase RlmH [Paenibacillus albiflavus]|uniref:Ribosomal RNA large subunit methyltransferase H n=1 Tax=Paenibacillus albiflavus TaxID=2545760 RepID=A0A4R4E975_9BACL|nr:23S rRNA (pseudouridine(1915)-N(3))-methyltransferase RlmH [Paenibacillus albiflavus]TCZ75727.1 23S rRNA (pseudouridine(1915)-N(3))-methyltransferase RlmH [Paenibacillus albiflavus]
MNIQIITVGKLKERYLVQGIAEYAKRLGAYAKVQFVEVPDEKAPESMSAAEEEQVRRKEGERILSSLREDSYAIALAIDGDQLASEQLAARLQDLATYGRSQVAFIIGGSLGLSPEVLRRADMRLSFGRMTLPHQLMRLVLVEQIYRAFKISRGEPYHK